MDLDTFLFTGKQVVIPNDSNKEKCVQITCSYL